MPYKYVTVEGPIVVGDTDHEVERELAYRYLGQEIGDIYLAAVADSVSRTVRLSPTRWRTVDYSALVERLLAAPASCDVQRSQPPGRCCATGRRRAWLP